jgi:hypothetical protein
MSVSSAIKFMLVGSVCTFLMPYTALIFFTLLLVIEAKEWVEKSKTMVLSLFGIDRQNPIYLFASRWLGGGGGGGVEEATGVVTPEEGMNAFDPTSATIHQHQQHVTMFNPAAFHALK